MALMIDPHYSDDLSPNIIRDFDLEEIPDLALFHLEVLDDEYHTYSDKYVQVVTKRDENSEPVVFGTLAIANINNIVRSYSKEEAIRQISLLVDEQIAPIISSSVDTSEIEFCRTKTLSQIRELLARKSPIEQAMLLVLLEHFKPEFFALDQQLITQGLVDLGGASEIVEQLNSTLMFCGSSHTLNSAELALIKYFLLMRVKNEAFVNLRGKHYNGWINIKAIVSSPKKEILKILVDVNHLKAPPELDIYWNHGLRPIDWEEVSKFITINIP